MTNLGVRLTRRRLDRERTRTRGQSLVEFALVFPLFFVLVLGFIEFAFAFNAILAVNFASRNAALIAAEAGDLQGGDCVILSNIEKDVGAPASHSNILKVDIYRAKSNGQAYAPIVGQPYDPDASWMTTYTRDPSTPWTCTLPDGTSLTVPYPAPPAPNTYPNNYPEADRCNLLITGCGGTHDTVDHIGVRIFYNHPYVTPLQTFVGTGNGISFDRSNVMRMEPVR